MRFFAILFTLAAVGLGVFAWTLPWAKPASFDVLLILFLLHNLLPMFVVAMAVGFACLALQLWLRILRGEAS